jgi:isoleucyl-tRNA synthetase
LPLLTDQLWPQLTGEASVHLADWPDATTLPADDDLVDRMDLVRDIASAAKSIREARGLRRRLPLASLTVAADRDIDLDEFVGLLADEVNVKAVEFAAAGSLGAERFEVDLKVVGRRLGKDTPSVVAAMQAGDYVYDADTDEVVAAGHRFGSGDYVRKLDADDPDATAALSGGVGLVRLDLEITPELEAEGLVRDLARAVNEARRADGLDVSDRIRLIVDPGHHTDIAEAVAAHEALLKSSTLAVEVVTSGPISEAHRHQFSDGRAVHLAVHRMAP